MRAPLFALALLATPAGATERILTLTEFDSVRVEGGYSVTVTTGRAAGGRISGSFDAVDRVSVEVQDRTLVVRRNDTGGGYQTADAGPVTIRLVAPPLRSAWLLGSGSLAIDQMRGPDVRVTIEGAGGVTVATVAADQLTVGLQGTGTAKLAGKANEVSAIVRGSATLDAGALTATNAVVTAEGSGDATLTATRTAKVAASGPGRVAVLGTPACTVTNTGAGSVRCGRVRAIP